MGSSKFLETILWLVGYDLSSLPEGAKDISLTWTNLPHSWGVFVMLAAVLAVAVAVVAVYRREIDTCPRRVKLLLAVVRMAVLLALVVILLGPALTYSQTRVREPYVVVLRDASQSMNTPDRYLDDADAAHVASATGRSTEEIRDDRPTRTDLVNELLSRDNEALLRRLQRLGHVQVYDFADQVQLVETRPAQTRGTGQSDDGASGDADASGDDGASGDAGTAPQTGADSASSPEAATLPPLDAQGRSTDIYSAIRKALVTNPLAAIVLITDGQRTTNDDLLSAAREALKREVPLIIVGVGDPNRPRNVKADNLYVRPEVWPNEPFEVEAVVVAEGLDTPEVTVELIEQTSSAADGTLGPEKIVATERIPLPEGGGRIRHSFSHTVTEPGNYVFSIRVPLLENEQAEDDNQLASQVVQALDREKIRVLLIAGAPSWDYRMVQRLLLRDNTVTVSCWLQTLDLERPQEGNEPIAKLPSSIEEFNKFDVIMLFDPNPNEFDEEWINLLKRFASEHSGGVLYMTGPKFSGNFLTNARTGSVKDILPVRFGDVGATQVATLLQSNQEEWRMRIVPSYADHPVMTFYPDRQDNLSRWESLPGVFWSFPAQEPKPTAQVLLEHGDPTLRQIEGSRPLLVAGRYGSANTLYIGFNGTWRWRSVGRQAEFFDRFWIQVTRYLVEGRSLKGRRRGYVQSERDRYEVGDKVTLIARLKDAAFQPLVLPERDPLDPDKEIAIEAVLEIGGQESIPVKLRPVARQPGDFEATLTARQTGVHTLRVILPEATGADEAKIDTSYTVELPRVETNQVWLNKPLLIELAGASGGKYYDVDEFDKIADVVPDVTEVIDVPGRPELIWSLNRAPFLILGLLVGLLCFEWSVRKWFKLL